jgi:hypothetical protein
LITKTDGLTSQFSFNFNQIQKLKFILKINQAFFIIFLIFYKPVLSGFWVQFDFWIPERARPSDFRSQHLLEWKSLAFHLSMVMGRPTDDSHLPQSHMNSAAVALTGLAPWSKYDDKPQKRKKTD